MYYWNRLSGVKKTSTLIIFLLLALSCWYFIFYKTSGKQEFLDRVIDVDTLNSPNTQIDVQPKPSVPHESAKAEVGNTKLPTATSKAPPEVKEWRRAHGYFLPDDLLAYEGYSNQTLIDLMKNGDLKAARVLGDRAPREGVEARKRYSDFLYAAAALGSTMALFQTPMFSVPADKLNDAAYQRNALINNLALFKVADLRGDIGFAQHFTLTKTKLYEDAFGPLNLTEREKLKIESLAKDHYKRLSGMRAQLGLPPFDNSTPEYIKQQLQDENIYKK